MIFSSKKGLQGQKVRTATRGVLYKRVFIEFCFLFSQVFSCEFCEIPKNTFFTENLWTTASRIRNSIQKITKEILLKFFSTNVQQYIHSLNLPKFQNVLNIKLQRSVIQIQGSQVLLNSCFFILFFLRKECKFLQLLQQVFTKILPYIRYYIPYILSLVFRSQFCMVF